MVLNRPPRSTGGPDPHLLTVGHGTTSRREFAALLKGARIKLIVDVRSAPGSRRHPQFGRLELEEWIPSEGIRYRWEPDLGGFRRPAADSRNVALRHPSFRGYADYMASDQFRPALQRVLADAAQHRVAIMCAETLWYRCHRRLIADAAAVLCGATVLHLGHDGQLSPHRLTEGFRCVQGDALVYDAGSPLHQTVLTSGPHPAPSPEGSRLG